MCWSVRGSIFSSSRCPASRAQQFPEYAALTSPKPLKADEIQALLGRDEALLFWLLGEKESYVFALTRDAFEWRTIAIGSDELASKVAAFRNGLNLDKLQKPAAKPVLFGLTLAHELYVALIGPVEALVKDKRHLLVVPSDYAPRLGPLARGDICEELPPDRHRR